MDVFCKIIAGEIPCYKIYEDEVIMCIMDVNPRSEGHVLIIPKKHYQDLLDIDNEVLAHIMEVAKKISLLLKERLGCDGITLEENNGCVQEVKHFHLHMIPRYHDKKVVHSSVEEVFQKLI